jgi:hypothetical protein
MTGSAGPAEGEPLDVALGTWVVDAVRQPMLPAVRAGSMATLSIQSGRLSFTEPNGRPIGSVDRASVWTEGDADDVRWLVNSHGRVLALRPIQALGPELATLVASPHDGPSGPEFPWGSGAPPASITRAYRGKQADVTTPVQIDATGLARYGYVPITQTYAPGSWGWAAWVAAFVMIVVIALYWVLLAIPVAIVLVLFMLLEQPAGMLTVVFERLGPPTGRQPPIAPAPVAGSASAATPDAPTAAVERLRRLEQLKAEGLVSVEEYTSTRTRILDAL